MKARKRGPMAFQKKIEPKPAPKCFNCAKVVTDDDYCFGCSAHVCGDCDTETAAATGVHLPDAHLEGVF